MKRPYDPTTRRTRNFLLLVIFAIALPSLLLTGFGFIAIKHESDASVKRMKSVYHSIIKKVAEGFNDRMDRLVAQSDPSLAQLETYATGKDGLLALELDRYMKTLPFATNYFSITKEKGSLLPRRAVDAPAEDPGSGWAPPLLN